MKKDRHQPQSVCRLLSCVFIKASSFLSLANVTDEAHSYSASIVCLHRDTASHFPHFTLQDNTTLVPRMLFLKL